jgi:AcrR family transcriptional regulator
MPYRPTERTEARRAQTREKIVRAALALVAHGGYREAQVAAVARRAGVATGTVYRHFPSKADLLTEVFRTASAREVEAVAQAGGQTAQERLIAAVETFARRALAGRRLAWALLAEPVDPAVEAERLQFRRAFADAFATTIAGGVARGELPPQDPAFTATALVGAIGEALVGPLSPTHAETDADVLVSRLITFCLRSTTDQELSDVHRRAA